MTALPIEIWSDVACPWCWVGKRRLDEAVAAFANEVTVTWRAFELDPTAPRQATERVDYAARLANKYGTTREQAQEMIERMVETGRSVGVEMRFDRIHPGNTFDAHRLLAWARPTGRQTALAERLFAAYLHEGRAVCDRVVLADLAADAGLDRRLAEAVLEGDTAADEVRDEERLAARLGIRAVPFFAIDRRVAVGGAQPSAVLLDAMRRAVEVPPSAG